MTRNTQPGEILPIPRDHHPATRFDDDHDHVGVDDHRASGVGTRQYTADDTSQPTAERTTFLL